MADVESNVPIYTRSGKYAEVRSPTASNFKAQIEELNAAGIKVDITTDTLAGLTVIGAGTAGTADANVMTVQGIAGMTALIMEGSGTAGTPAGGVLTIQGQTGMTPVDVNVKAQYPTNPICECNAAASPGEDTPTEVVSYTVGSANTFYLTSWSATCSDGSKWELIDSDEAATPVLTTKMVAFTGSDGSKTVVWQDNTGIKVDGDHKIYLQGTALEDDADLYGTLVGYYV